MNVISLMQMLSAGAVLIGVAALFGGFRFRRRARQSLAWRQVPAKVLEFDLIYEDDTDFPGYVPKIRYRYAFGDETYESTVFRPVFNAQLGEADVDAWKQRYLPGAAITVHVDPNDPSRAAVDKHVPRTLGWVLLLFGSIFAFTGTLMFVVMTVLAQYAPQ